MWGKLCRLLVAKNGRVCDEARSMRVKSLKRPATTTEDASGEGSKTCSRLTKLADEAPLV